MPAATRPKADECCRRYRGVESYGSYSSAIDDPRVDAVVVAVPPRFHLDLTRQALAAGKHVLVEKPAFPRMADYEAIVDARNAAGRVVLVGENDHYKPLAVCLRALLKDGVIGEMIFAHFTTLAHRLKSADDWRNDETMAGGDAFFEEGIHWLHLAGSLGPAIATVHGYRPDVSRNGPDTPREEHDGGLHLRQRRGGIALLLARGPVAAAGAPLVEALRPQGNHHVRIERRVRRRPRRRAAEARSCRDSGTSAAIAPCIATSRGRYGKAARPK